MNVFLYSEDRHLLQETAKAVRHTGETPFIVPDFNTLQAFITQIDPDIAFVDEALFPQDKLEYLQRHIFDVFLDFPVTLITNPYCTTYRGKVSEQKFRELADAVMDASKNYTKCSGLSPKLSSLFNFLLLHKDEKIETTEMMYHLWNDSNPAHKKTLHTYICKLRKKLAESGNNCILEKVGKSTYSLRPATN